MGWLQKQISFIVLLLQIVSHVYLCAGQDVILSLRNRQLNRILLICLTSARGPENNWSFWLEDSPMPIEVLDRTDLSITVAASVTFATEGVYYCRLGNETSNPLGPFTTDPNHAIKQDVPFYHVSIDQSRVLLPNPIPLPTGYTRQYYSITWTNSSSHALNDPTKYLQILNGSLTVLHLSENDSGNYSLKIAVTNPIVNGTFVYATNRYYINVQESPRFVDIPTDTIKTVIGTGDNSDFHCEVSGFPSLSIQWCHNGVKIQDNSKYDIVKMKTNGRIASNLTINSLDAFDNGNVSCKAQISGCDIVKSFSDCVPITLSDIHTANISVITDSFSYTVTVVDGGNLQLKIDLEGNLIPVPIRVYIRYIEHTTENEEEVISSQTNVDLVILLYIRKDNIPYNMFKIQVALGTELINSKLYKVPTNDKVIDIAKDDVLCNIIPWITAIIVVGIALPLIIILVIIIFVGCTVFAVKKRKIINKHEIKMQVLSRLPDDEINTIAKNIFPRCYDSTQIASDGDDDSFSIVPPPIEFKEWMNATDNILIGISDKNKKRSLMKLLINAVYDENWLEDGN